MPNKTITKEKGENLTVDLIDWEATAKAQEESKKKEEEKKKKAEEAKQKKKDEEAKKPKFFDRGFWGGVGLAIGAAIGFATGLAIAAIPFLISAVAAGIYKAVSYGVQSARYRAAQNEQRAKNLKAEADAKKTDTPEKEETKDKTAEKVAEKDLSKGNSIEKAEIQKDVDLVKQDSKGISHDQSVLLNQVVITRHDINGMLQEDKGENFVDAKKDFLEQLSQACVLKELEMAIRSGKTVPMEQLEQSHVEASAKEFAKQEAFQRMADSIQTKTDMERFTKLALENEGGGLMEELRKHNLKAKDAQEIKEKAMEKTAGKEKEQEQKQMTQATPQTMQ